MAYQEGRLHETVAQCGPMRLSAWQGLLLVVLVATALRIFGLGDRCFHGDELLSVSIASSTSMAELQRVTEPAWHPPLHYAVPRLLYLAGAQTEAQWRSAGVLFGVLMVAVTFLIPLLWGATNLSLPAGLLAATSPMAVLFSQTARWHPLVGGMLALGALGLVLAVRRNRFWAWLLAGLCFALAFHTVYLAGIPAMLLLLLALYELLRQQRPLTGVLTASLLWLLLVGPWLQPLASWLQPGAIHWEPLRSILGSVGRLLLMLQNLMVGPTVLPWNWAVMVPAVLLVGCLGWRFFITGQPQLRSLRWPVLMVVLGCLLVPMLAPITASSRYWMVLLVPIHIGIAGGLVSIASLRLRQICAVGLALLFGYGLFNLYTHRQYQYRELTDDWRALAEMTRANVQPGDQVWSIMTPFLYYYGPEALNVYQWYYHPEAVAEHVRSTRPGRVFLQYSPLSEWEVISFSRMAQAISKELSQQGFIRKSRAYYGRDPDAAAKRYYMRGRDFPEYRHALELWVPKS